MSGELSVGFQYIETEGEPITIIFDPAPCPASITMSDGQRFDASGPTPRETMVNLLEMLKAHYGTHFRLVWGDEPDQRIEI